MGSTLDLYDSFRWFHKALQAYAMFAYTLAPGLFAHGRCSPTPATSGRS